ncbi:DUF4253 domain-containing protein [Streptomyces sp. WAC 06725]|uniref:DUF4253 domain-containing protein n=1 Tax=Streptomyces sp. WAC 06725 TaxID=2203209 RepID=UPI0021ADDA03|nr:DUF4253 domain-containing protein [Streptomyces sp. WAC 06725]
MNVELSLPRDAVLPSGRTVTAEGGGDIPVLWLSDDAVSGAAGLWTRLREEHAGSGLWPLLLEPLRPDDEGEFRPWATGELYPEDMSSPQAHDPAALLEAWWDKYGEEEWPGLAPGREPEWHPDEVAAEFAEGFAARRPYIRLGLVAAGRGADALTAVGWSGRANYDNDTAKYSAVVRDWERRFGARVVTVGFDTLHLSVAAPPISAEEALLVAAEHFAFCPDLVWQGSGTLAAYAESLVGAGHWEFWWD